MILQTVHEIVNPFDVYVRLYHSGQHRVVDMRDLVEYGNPSAGEALVPVIPEGWEVTP